MDSAKREIPRSNRLRDVLALAKDRGLLRGNRTVVVRGNMPEALVARAKARTGIRSNTALIELALASLAVWDDYPEWLLSQRGAVGRNLPIAGAKGSRQPGALRGKLEVGKEFFDPLPAEEFLVR